MIERSRGVMWRGRDEARGEEEERLGSYDGKQLCVTEEGRGEVEGTGDYGGEWNDRMWG